MKKKQTELFCRALFGLVYGAGVWALIIAACAGALYIERILGF